MIDALPRLAYIADVPVERTTGGMLLLYRLLQHYPRERLLVVSNPGYYKPHFDLRLPDIQYCDYNYRIPRIVRNRFNPAWPLVMAARLRQAGSEVCNLLRDFAPEAILTVSHHFLWLAAASVARRLSIPLHLILHDDWPSLITFHRPGLLASTVRWGCRRQLGRVYRNAASRLCVSPGMESQYRRWFGVAGTVLYPNRGDDSPLPRIRVRRDPGAPPVVAFCGMIHPDGMSTLMRAIAKLLADLGGHLDLYTPLRSSALAAFGLLPPTVRLRGFLPAAELGDQIGATAHALFLPASFDSNERMEVATLFPSKLADYTAIGLPVLVWGPEYSSAARWASDNPGAAELVTDPEIDAVRRAVVRLTTQPEYAARVASAGMAAGSSYFDPANSRRTFLQALATKTATS